MKNTSINRYNVAVVDQSGKVGTVRYYQKGGRTYVRAASNRVDSNSNPRSDGQMKTRLLYNSRNAMYRLLKGLLKGAFQFKPRHLSEYQAYMQANAGIGCYMTKDEYRDGKIVLLPVKVAEGELAEIEFTGDISSVAKTTLNLVITSPPDTMGDISRLIVEQNEGFEYGDQITFIYGKKNKKATVFVLVLDASDTTPAGEEITTADSMLAFKTVDVDFCAAIHSNSERQMSNSVVALTSAAQAELTSYTSAAKFEAARDSYGKAKTSILVPSKSVSVSEPEQDGDDNNGGESETPATVAAPTISGASPFASTSEVTLSAADGAAIHYTTDGSVPTSESQTYAAPFTISSTTIVKAIAIKDGVSSEVASKTFTKSSSNDD